MNSLMKAIISEINVEIEKEDVKGFVKAIIDMDFYVNYSENEKCLLVNIKYNKDKNILIRFIKNNEIFKLQPHIHVENKTLLMMIEKLVEDNLGSALITEERNEKTVIRKMNNGELISIEVIGDEHHLLLEKKELIEYHSDDMSYLMECKKVENDIADIKEKIDDKLSLLNQAIASNKKKEINKLKKELQELQQKLFILEG